MHNYVTNLCIVLYCNWGVDHPLGLSVFCLPSINNNNNNKLAENDIRNTHEIEHEIVLKCQAISSSSQISYFLRLMSLWTAPASSQCLNIQSTNIPIMMPIFASHPPVTYNYITIDYI